MKQLFSYFMLATLIFTAGLGARAQEFIQSPSNQPPFAYLTELFSSAQNVTLRQLAEFGSVERINMVTQDSGSLTTSPGEFGYYQVNIVDESGNVLTTNWLMQATVEKAQSVIRSDGTVLVTDVLGQNLDCYDLSKLAQGLVTQNTPEGAVVIDSLGYFTKPDCPSPKFDQIISTIRQSGDYLVTKTDMLKNGATVNVGYYYSWKASTQ